MHAREKILKFWMKVVDRLTEPVAWKHKSHTKVQMLLSGIQTNMTHFELQMKTFPESTGV